MGAAIFVSGQKQGRFLDKVKAMLPQGGNLDLCLTCGACSAGCPATGLEDMDPRKFLRMAAMGLEAEFVGHKWVWLCSMCGRCTHACPMGINFPGLIMEARNLTPREQRPRGILQSCDMQLKNDSTSATGTPPDEFQFVVEDVLNEVRETQPGWENLQAPIDKQGAHFFVSQNSREPVSLPEEMVPLWKILHLAGADWTYGSTAWAGENYCMFLSDAEAWRHITTATVAKANALGCKVYLNTECGHSTYSVNQGIRRFKLQTDLKVLVAVHMYAQWIKEGTLRPSSAWNDKLKLKFTVQDPCNQVRKEYGDVYAEDLRFVVKAVVGADNFIDMVPNRSNNYCCGGGGGYLQSGFNEERWAYGRFKFDQIIQTKADYCITPCHNCHAQIHDLSHHFEGGGFGVSNLWSFLALSLGALGENERADFDERLMEVWLPGKPGTPDPFAKK
ncbi:MAG: (Fe-S)-binding protein [Desulfobulbaceae bacterium]|jgi:Fe-S oxidoreductase|nr:(Fe-S)-binding protein [Desulfobulbaceae bacterium]